ncbi:MAG: DUF2855 family protein [Rhodobacteraceae bacterium]|nr:DUF2855 family protein [Paracoccaceae bacterium]
MSHFFQVLTDAEKITDQRTVRRETVPLRPGEARLAIESFALTANNVTYAATGHQIGYWKFFPVPEAGMGIVPVWGFARVIESTSDVLEVGTRLYGFLPFAEELVITPVASGASGIVDATEHRVTLPAVYNAYARVNDAAQVDEPYRALLQPLIATSFLLADWLDDNRYFGARQVIVGSASSKTGLGLCAFLSRAAGKPVSVVGLTSAGNAGFVDQLGYCNQVVRYDDISAVAKIPSVYVDMSGNAAVKHELHAHLGDLMRHSSAVGISHWDKFAAPKDLAGPKPQFFFAPAQIAKRKEDWGPGAINGKIREATVQIANEAERWLTLERHPGFDAAMQAFGELAAGRSDPTIGHIVVV